MLVKWMTGSDLINAYASQDDTMFFITSGSSDTLALANSSSDHIMAYGQNQSVNLLGDDGVTIWDHGKGLVLNWDGHGDINVFGFQYDPQGVVSLARAVIPATVTADGQGGTLVSAGTGHIDLRGDTNVGMMQIRVHDVLTA